MNIDNIRSKHFPEETVQTYIELTPNELERDYVGLFEIIGEGKRSFSLSGPDLEEFTRRALAAVLDRGAVPVSGPNPDRELSYGTERNEIIDNIVKYWLYESDRDPDVGDVWFGVPGVTFD